jgi:signal transduction histidine kinase
MDKRSSDHDAYGPAYKPLVGEWIDPDRLTLFNFRYYWSHIQAAVILLITTLALVQAVDIQYILAIDVLYIVWNSLASRYQQKLQTHPPVNFVRYLLPVLGTFAITWWIGDKAQSLWLLYFVPMLMIGVELERYLAFGVIGIDVLCVLLTSLLFSNHSMISFLGIPVATGIVLGCMRAAMVSYIGLTSYFLFRSLAYVYQLNNRLLHLLPQIVSEPYGWEDAAHQVVTRVAESFSDIQDQMIVNVFTLSGENLFLTASSSEGGKRLIARDFNFRQELGITGTVARTGETRFIKNVAHDPEGLFSPQAEFQNVKSELAVPIKVSGKVVGVLDIESQRPNVFGDEDRQAMEFISAHLTEIYKQTYLLGKYQKLAQLSTGLASKMIGIRDLGTLLKEIGDVAISVLDAQLIGYYYKAPLTGETKGPFTAGAVRYPECLGVKDRSNPLVESLFHESGIRLFYAAQTDPDLLGEPDRTDEDPPFVVREEIIACAVVPLKVRAETIGLMFINYRREEKFSQDLLDMIEIITPLAALAMESAIQEESIALARRQRLRDELHNTVSHKLLCCRACLESLEKAQPGSPEWKSYLAIAEKNLLSATAIVQNIVHGEDQIYSPQSLMLNSILLEVNKDVDLIRKVFGIEVIVEAGNIPDRYRDAMVHEDVQYLIDESLYNAARHSQAAHIEVRIWIQNLSLNIHIHDDGIGFEEKTVRRGSGLNAMRSKVEFNLKGTMLLNTRPAGGTCIDIQIPAPVIQIEE